MCLAEEVRLVQAASAEKRLRRGLMIILEELEDPWFTYHDLPDDLRQEITSVIQLLTNYKNTEE
jgi:hypothetical protein